MNKKEQIEKLNSTIKEQHESIKQLQTNLETVQNTFRDREMAYQAAQVNNLSGGIAKIPFNDLDIYSQKLLDPSLINTHMSIKVKDSLAGIGIESGGGGSFLVYLLVLERARYFQSCVVFKGEDTKLIKLLYKALFYGSMNGSIAIVKEDSKYFLAYVTTKKINKYGELKECELQTFNYHNTTDFESETLTYKGNNINKVIIFDFNNEDFGLWVLCWFYLNNIYEFFQTLINQQQLLNKKFVFRGDLQTPNIRDKVIKSIIDKSTVIWLDKDIDLKQLEAPNVDLGQTFNLIENYTNYFDFHILGIRTKDISDSSKSRDIASQQLNHTTQADNKEQYIDYFIEELLFKIKEQWKIEIEFENRNINLSEDIKQKSITIDKLNSGGGENYD